MESSWSPSMIHEFVWSALSDPPTLLSDNSMIPAGLSMDISPIRLGSHISAPLEILEILDCAIMSMAAGPKNR